MRHRTNGMQNGDVTPPAASSEAEDGYDTSTAVDSSKVLDSLSQNRLFWQLLCEQMASVASNWLKIRS